MHSSMTDSLCIMPYLHAILPSFSLSSDHLHLNANKLEGPLPSTIGLLTMLSKYQYMESTSFATPFPWIVCTVTHHSDPHLCF
jgi:hypothetical protein